jgi:type II secretory pathway component PulM
VLHSVFHGDAHALLMTVYKDLKQPIGLRMEAAKAALPYEKPRLASIENKVVDEFDNMSTEEIEAWLDERAEQRVRRCSGAAASGRCDRRQRRASLTEKME